MTKVKPALQKRSKETRDRLIAALDRLLRKRPFEEIAVVEIAEEAGVSVGSVYRRFENKDAFVPVLFDLYRQRVREFVKRQKDDAAHAPDDLRGALQYALMNARAIIEEEGHLMRAVHLYARIRPELVSEEWAPLIEESRNSIRMMIEQYKDQITIHDAETAAEALTYFLNTVLTEEGLYGHLASSIALSIRGKKLAQEMADFAYGYLTMDRSGG